MLAASLRNSAWASASISSALVELFQDDFAETTANRFEESAYVLSKSDRGDDAQACAAAARAFRDSPVAENPVAKALLEESLGSFLESLRSKDRDKEKDGDGDGDGDEESLIVKP